MGANTQQASESPNAKQGEPKKNNNDKQSVPSQSVPSQSDDRLKAVYAELKKLPDRLDSTAAQVINQLVAFLKQLNTDRIKAGKVGFRENIMKYFGHPEFTKTVISVLDNSAKAVLRGNMNWASLPNARYIDKPGIYLIEFQKMVYVGAAKDIAERIRTHLGKISKDDDLLYKAMVSEKIEKKNFDEQVRVVRLYAFEESHFQTVEKLGASRDEVLDIIETLFINFFGPTQARGISSDDVEKWMKNFNLPKQPFTGNKITYIQFIIPPKLAWIDTVKTQKAFVRLEIAEDKTTSENDQEKYRAFPVKLDEKLAAPGCTGWEQESRMNVDVEFTYYLCNPSENPVLPGNPQAKGAQLQIKMLEKAGFLKQDVYVQFRKDDLTDETITFWNDLAGECERLDL
ncbi:hypothetical protein HDV05_004682 [Chytridiales sp. JEL 0842]|nr:hypothetical protein HDV05_004682 [Chytridiales sp. JEL 0842]